MDDEFNSLAMKKLARMCSEEESKRFEDLLKEKPLLNKEFAEMEKEFPAAIDLFSMLPDPEEEKEEIPEYVRNMLQGEVSRTFASQQQEARENLHKKHQPKIGLLWKFALAGGLCVCVLTISGVLDFGSKSNTKNNEHIAASNLKPVVTLAVLDFIGPLRSGNEDTPEKAFNEVWPGVDPKEFSETPDSDDWLKQWDTETNAPQVKVMYNLNEGIIEVFGYNNGETKEKSIDLDGRALPEVLPEIQTLIAEWYQPN